jgi:hypothetical protein
LEKQLNKEDKMRERQKKVMVVEDIAKGIQDELRNQIDKYDGLLNKHVIIEKEVAKVNRSTKDKINTIESNMRDYQKRVESSMVQIMVLQSELEIQEHMKELKSHYLIIEEGLLRTKQEHLEC